jgi:two-component system, NtrC family, sensor histidine kinase PilS
MGPSAAPARLQLDVMDDGPGVAAEALPHLFEPFFTTEAQGTGLGLYIARELCEGNNARIEAMPDAGFGHFRITLRAAR